MSHAQSDYFIFLCVQLAAYIKLNMRFFFPFHFVRPSELLSFAVIDFSTSGRAKEYLNVLFKVMQSHGMPLPSNVNLSRALETVYFSIQECREPCYTDSPDGVSLIFSQPCESKVLLFISLHGHLSVFSAGIHCFQGFPRESEELLLF